MVKTLKDHMEDKDEDKTDEIAVYLNREEAEFFLRQAKRKIEASAYVIKNKKKYDKPDEAEANAKRSAKVWEKLALKIESQLS